MLSGLFMSLTSHGTNGWITRSSKGPEQVLRDNGGIHDSKILA